MNISDHFFCVGEIIKLRESLKTYPCLKDIPEYTKSADIVPYYLGPLMDGFITSDDILLVLEVFKEKLNIIPYAYKCLFNSKIIYIVRMKDVNIDPNICFIKCK